jgi:hypothetical protein
MSLSSQGHRVLSGSSGWTDERERHEFGPFALLARPVHGQRLVEGDDVPAPHLSPRHRLIVDEAEHPELKTGRGVLEGPHKATDLEGHPSRASRFRSHGRAVYGCPTS